MEDLAVSEAWENQTTWENPNIKVWMESEMAQEIKLGKARIADFGVTDASRANGFGLHVAASREADGKGVFAECFLHADAAGKVKLVYVDAGRSEARFLGSLGTLLQPPIELVPPATGGGTVGDPVGGIAAVGNPVGLPGTGTIGAEVEPEPTLDSVMGSTFDWDPDPSDLRGSHRYEIELGPRESIVSIAVSISGRQLTVDCLRRSEHTVNPARAFKVSGVIPWVEGDLGSRPVLFYSSNGLLSGDSEGAGSGWKTKEPKTRLDGSGSDDRSLGIGGHDNDDPIDPIGG